MKPGEGTQQTDKGKGKEVKRREGSPPLQTHQITSMEQTREEQTRERSKTPVEHLADMAQRVMTPEPGPSGQGDSNDSSDSEAWREHRREIAKGKKAVRTLKRGESEEREPERKRT